MSRVTAVFVQVLLLAATCLAGVNQWTGGEPEGIWVNQILIGPQDPSILYATDGTTSRPVAMGGNESVVGPQDAAAGLLDDTCVGVALADPRSNPVGCRDSARPVLEFRVGICVNRTGQTHGFTEPDPGSRG